MKRLIISLTAVSLVFLGCKESDDIVGNNGNVADDSLSIEYRTLIPDSITPEKNSDYSALSAWNDSTFIYLSFNPSTNFSDFDSLKAGFKYAWFEFDYPGMTTDTSYAMFQGHANWKLGQNDSSLFVHTMDSLVNGELYGTITGSTQHIYEQVIHPVDVESCISDDIIGMCSNTIDTVIQYKMSYKIRLQ